MHSLLTSIFAVAHITGTSSTDLPTHSISNPAPVETKAEQWSKPSAPAQEQKDTNVTIIYGADRTSDVSAIGLDGFKGCMEVVADEAERVKKAIDLKEVLLLAQCHEPENITTEMSCLARDELPTTCARLPAGSINELLEWKPAP